MLWRDDGHADVPSRERRRRHRLRDHARDPRLGPPAERGAARRAAPRARIEPPQVIHHGLVVGADGKKLSKRAEGATVASLRDAGYPAEAVRAYLEELDLPRARRASRPRAHPLALGRRARRARRRRALAARAGVPVEAAPLLRGAHDLVEARRARAQRARPHPVRGRHTARRRSSGSSSCARSFPEVLDRRTRRRRCIRELKAVGGNLQALRVALTAARARARALGRRCARCRGTRRCAAHYPRGRAPLRHRTRARSSSCRPRPARSACTSAARPSTRARTSATRARS